MAPTLLQLHRHCHSSIAAGTNAPILPQAPILSQQHHHCHRHQHCHWCINTATGTKTPTYFWKCNKKVLRWVRTPAKLGKNTFNELKNWMHVNCYDIKFLEYWFKHKRWHHLGHHQPLRMWQAHHCPRQSSTIAIEHHCNQSPSQSTWLQSRSQWIVPHH